MKNINEVLRKLAETRLPCPTFIMDELERLYYESDENGMATALLEADLLSTKKELAERDRTIAQLQEMDALHTSGAKQLVQDLHTLRLDRDELRKALEESRDVIVDALSVADMEKRDMLLEPWSSLADQKNRIVKALGE